MILPIWPLIRRMVVVADKANRGRADHVPRARHVALVAGNNTMHLMPIRFLLRLIQFLQKDGLQLGAQVLPLVFLPLVNFVRMIPDFRARVSVKPSLSGLEPVLLRSRTEVVRTASSFEYQLRVTQPRANSGSG